MIVAASYIEHDHRGSWACAVLCGGIICRNCNDFTGMRDLIAGDWLKIVHNRKIVAGNAFASAAGKRGCEK